MSVSNDKVIERWSQRVRTGENPVGAHGRELSMDGRNLLAVGDTLYSYGRHFPLAIAARDKHERVTHFLLNADRYSVTTSQHQGMARNLCQRLANDLGGVPVILLPFSALDAAGISVGDVEPIDVRADRNETERRSSRAAPGDRHVLMEHPDGETFIDREYSHGTEDREDGTLYARRGYSGPWVAWPADAQTPEDAIELEGKEQPFRHQPSILHDEDAWRAWRERFHGISRQIPVRKPVMVPNPDAVYVGRSSWLTATRDDEGVWRWEVQHHWLGDSLFRARVRETVTVKATDAQNRAWERRSAALVAYHEAQEHCRAEERHWGYEVSRSPEMLRELADQRDAHWIAAQEAEAELTALLPRGHAFSASRRTENRLTITRQRTRRPYFLSSFDYQEARPLYFLCELPASARPTTVAEAIACLRPPEVVAAEARGLKVTRQGDLFAIPTRLDTRTVRRMRGRGRNVEKRLRVLGTNHSVTEGVICKGGAVFGRGVMRHEPDAWRQPDHARKRLGDGRTWHMLVRNTVPRTTA